LKGGNQGCEQTKEKDTDGKKRAIGKIYNTHRVGTSGGERGRKKNRLRGRSQTNPNKKGPRGVTNQNPVGKTESRHLPTTKNEVLYRKKKKRRTTGRFAQTSHLCTATGTKPLKGGDGENQKKIQRRTSRWGKGERGKEERGFWGESRKNSITRETKPASNTKQKTRDKQKYPQTNNNSNGFVHKKGTKERHYDVSGAPKDERVQKKKLCGSFQGRKRSQRKGRERTQKKGKNIWPACGNER